MAAPPLLSARPAEGGKDCTAHYRKLPSHPLQDIYDKTPHSPVIPCTNLCLWKTGFSSLQIFILVLSFISLTLSVGLGVPVFIFLQKQGLHVEGPSSPLVVHPGGSVLLPCSVRDPLPLEGLRVEWRRTESESVVNVLQQKDIRADLQSETFRGRANFFPEEISKGNFSILLSDITREDAGVYRCGVHFNQDLSETTVEVQLS
ncbi:hypothetical protein NFI96_006055, partial [Prochilodus magdalenae]